MPNAYTQIYIQIVFAVEGRQCLIRPEYKEELHKYIRGIVNHRGQKLLAIHCMPDHSHLFVGQKPNIALSDLVHDVKKPQVGSSVKSDRFRVTLRGRKALVPFLTRIHRSRR